MLIICDNTMDLLLPDEGPARRLPLAGMGRRTPMLESPVLQDGKTPDAPLAQHGFPASASTSSSSSPRSCMTGRC